MRSRSLIPSLFVSLLAASAHAQAPAPTPAAPPAAPPPSAPTAAPAAAPAQAAPPAPAPAAAPSLFEQFDALYAHREVGDNVAKCQQLIAQAIAKNPNDYEAWWRKAMLACWRANGYADGSDLKAMAGKSCMEAGDKAVELNANDVKGTYWGGVGVGVYSEGVGILTALTQGLEGKFRERTQLAMKLDGSYNEGGPQQLWGRFFYKLPWPKRDVDESVKQLEEAHKAFPTNLRTRLYLADSYDSNGKKAEALALVKGILTEKPRDAEDMRVQGLATRWLKDHE